MRPWPKMDAVYRWELRRRLMRWTRTRVTHKECGAEGNGSSSDGHYFSQGTKGHLMNLMREGYMKSHPSRALVNLAARPYLVATAPSNAAAAAPTTSDVAAGAQNLRSGRSGPKACQCGRCGVCIVQPLHRPSRCNTAYMVQCSCDSPYEWPRGRWGPSNCQCRGDGHY